MITRKLLNRASLEVKNFRQFSVTNPSIQEQTVRINYKDYKRDEWTNVTDKIASYAGRNLHMQRGHPLYLVAQRVVDHFYSSFRDKWRSSEFSTWSNMPKVVSVEQNFDSLLIPKDHVSRSRSDCYYVNKELLLRAHTTCHQVELINKGVHNFLVIGDVYRRDEIDSTHYPVFHQIDGVRLHSRKELFPNEDFLDLFELGDYTRYIGSQEKQACHSIEAVAVLEYEMKDTLLNLARKLFDHGFKYRWVDTKFPFTQPSWELEVYHEGQWLEILGCGIIKQPIITNAGVNHKVGWAFGLGLERLAMCLYKIPDIRLFWSTDSGFLNQFKNIDENANVTYKPVSQYPQCINDISFWLPYNIEYSHNDFYDLVRTVGGDIIEQVTLKDEFIHPRTGKKSNCYRIVYRHMERTLTQEEVNVIHRQIEEAAVKNLLVSIR